MPIRQTQAVTWRSRPTRWLEAASTAWTAGEAVYLVGLIVYAYGVGGAAAVSVVALLQALPSVVVAPLVMTATDWLPRGRLTAIVLAVRVASVGLAAVALALSVPVAVVFGLATIDAIAAALLRPIRSALVPMLARTPDELVSANVAITTGASAAGLAGPALAAALLATAGVGPVFALGAAGLLVALVATGRLGVADEPRHGRTAAAPTRGARLGALLRLDAARTIAALVVGQRFVRGMLTVLVATTAIELLSSGDEGVGILNAAIGLGGLVGSVLAMRLIARFGLAAAFAGAMALWGIGLAAPAAVPLLVAAVGCFAVAGVGKALIEVSGASLLQRTVPTAVRGPVLGVLESLVTAALAGGALAASVLVAVLGAAGALLAAGLITLVILGLSLPRLRRVDEAVVVPERERRLLRGVSFFEPLPLNTLEDLASGLETVRVPAGTDVVRQGEAGDRFYIVEHGRVATYIDGAVVRELGPGESFGEIALLRDVPRTATVRALVDATLVALSRDDFLRAVTGHTESVSAADAVVRARYG
ncbi:MAG TPA: cyclic nucleotide-binding domain-containing protein [Clostridia bacterium]|nr:cyclic nucleotide-binding domain-containing protein [Clostridia bacterium]